MRIARPARPTPSRPLRTPVSLAPLCAVVTIVLACFAASTASAATALSWSGGTTGADIAGPAAVSCPSSTFCVAVGAGGQVAASDNPAAGRASWVQTTPVSGADLTGVSCVSSGSCVAVSAAGQIFTTSSLAAGWSEAGATGVALSGVSCAPGICVAVGGQGDAFVSSGAGFAPIDIDGARTLTAVSCLSASFCVAVDSEGNALASTAPTSAWSLDPIAAGGSPLRAVACEASGYCAATDEAGRVLLSANPTASETAGVVGPEWSATNLGSGPLPAVSCASGTCVAASSAGLSFAGEDLAARPAAWSASTVGSASGNLDAISCAPGSVCVAVAAPAAGGALEAFDAAIPPPPAKETPSEKPAPVEPPPAKLPPLVTPSPLIAGNPAAGQTLTCEAGIPEGVVVALAYQWFANQKAIPGATNPKYKVRSGDEGDHIQCAVTATDAAGSVEATSGWVSIPRAEAPKSIGETSVSKASVKAGKVSFSVECSAHAVGHCQIEAKLVVFERVRAGKVLAVSASRPRTHSASKRRAERSLARQLGKRERATPHAAVATSEGSPSGREGSTGSEESTGNEGGSGGARSVETTIGSLKVSVKAGHTRKLSVRLNSTGIKLLGMFKQGLKARLTVSGTVIGVLTGQLSSQSVKLSSGSSSTKHGSPKHATTTRRATSERPRPPRHSAPSSR